MKRKELIQLVIAIVILVAAGALIYSQLVPKKATSSSKGTTVEKITPVDPSFDSSALSTVNDRSKTQDFYQAPNLSSGVGNSQPFGTH